MSEKSKKAILVMTLACLLMLGSVSLVSEFAEDSFLPLANKSIPIFILAICLWTGYRVAKLDPLMIWSPLPWFLGVSALYYGFGPLLYHYGNPESVSYVNAYYPVVEQILFRTNTLNTIGIVVILIGYQIGMYILPRIRRPITSSIDTMVLRRLFFALLAVGIPIKYFLSIPYQLGLLNWVLPGSIKYFSVFSSLAIIVLFAMVKGGMKNYRIPLCILIIVELTTGLMTFSKMEVIVVLLAILLGIFLYRPRFVILIAGGVFIAFMYIVFLTPFVTYGRLAYNLGGVSNVAQLAKAIKGYSEEGKGEGLGEFPYVQGWWSRLNYANAQAFAMDAYDKGRPGDTFSLIPYAFVPRIIYPDKPIMTPGIEFTETVTGMDHSSTAAGIFGEAYWNGGWGFVVLTCFYVGILYSLFTKVAIWHISKQRLAYLPVVFIGIIMGLRPDDWFVATYVGTFLQAIFLYVAIYIIVTPILSQRKCVAV